MSEYIVRMPSDMPYEIKAELNAWYVASEPIVRCRDCKHWATESRFTGGCTGKKLDPDGFCSWAERKAKAIIELLPCPFCGGDNIGFNNEYEPMWSELGCYDCECIVIGKTKDEAIARWNTRAQTVFGMTLDEVRQMMKRDAERVREYER